MRTFFTADPHFEHERILEITDRYLDFKSVEEHNDAIIAGINQWVAREDRLFILGDFAWRSADSWLRRINCQNLHLIIGNHDRAQATRLFKTCQDTALVKIDGEHRFFLSHYPHAYWPASHRGSIHLYGHVHAEREATLDSLFPGRRSLDCGVDNARLLLGSYRPFSEGDVLRLMDGRPGHDHVSWYDEQRSSRRARASRFPEFPQGTWQGPVTWNPSREPPT